MKITLKVFLFLAIICNYYSVNAQVVGVIYGNQEAEQKFGKVINSLEMPSIQLESLLKMSGKYIMFKIADKNLFIIDENRKPLYPDNISVKSDEVFKLLSVSKVLELLNEGQNRQTFFEERENAFSITNGSYTLEQSALCPPFCIQ